MKNRAPCGLLTMLGNPNLCLYSGCVECYPTSKNIMSVYADMVAMPEESDLREGTTVKEFVGDLEEAFLAGQELLKLIEKHSFCFECEKIGTECHCNCGKSKLHESCDEVNYSEAK